MSPSCTCSLVAAKNVLGKASDANRGMAGSKLEGLGAKEESVSTSTTNFHNHIMNPLDEESWHNRAVHSQRVSSKACKARYQHVRMGIPAGDSLDFIDSRKHVPFFMHF